MDYRRLATSGIGDQTQARRALIKIQGQHEGDWIRTVTSGKRESKDQSVANVWGQVADHLINGLTRADGISPKQMGMIDNEIDRLAMQLEAQKDTNFEPISEQALEIIHVAGSILKSSPSTNQRLRHLVEVCSQQKIKTAGEEEERSPKIVKLHAERSVLEETEKKATDLLEQLKGEGVRADNKDLVTYFDVLIVYLKECKGASQKLLKELIKAKESYVNHYVKAQLRQLQG